MSAPLQAPIQHQNGLQKSAALMRALGARGNRLWSGLTQGEAATLSEAMTDLKGSQANQAEALESFNEALSASRNRSVAGSSPTISATVWHRLSELDLSTLQLVLKEESPQVLAVVLTRLKAETSALFIRALAPAAATEILRRVLHLGPIKPVAIRALEQSLSARLASLSSLDGGAEGVARIVDALDSRREGALLSALDEAEPGASEAVRAFMFTFEDLASLDPASLQTLLAGLDRSVLILALKGAPTAISSAFFANMTARAGDLLRSEIEALGPARRSDIEAARLEVRTLARTLARRGEILNTEPADGDLIE